MTKTMEFILEYSGRSGPGDPLSPPLEALTTPAQMKRVDFEMVAQTGSKVTRF